MRRLLVLTALFLAGLLALAAVGASAKPVAHHHAAKAAHTARGGHGKGARAKGGRAISARVTRARLAAACGHVRKGVKRLACERRVRLARFAYAGPPPPLKPFHVPTPLSDEAVAAVIPAAMGLGHKGYASCGDAPEPFVRAAEINARTLDSLDWAPFGAHEQGWQVYELLVGHEIGTTCGSGTPVFAQALAAFQAKYQLPPDGVMTPAVFEVFKGVLQERRAFVMDRVHGICPEAPAEARLILVPKSAETFEREDRKMRADVWAAYQRMVTAARAEVSALRDDPKALTIFSGYRSPQSDAARCDIEGNCDGLRRASCSAHRTGTALDLNVGWIPGVAADSTSPENRLLQTRTAAYRWLVANAGRFGFVNYPYEPWHWEWVGDATTVAASSPPSPVASPPLSAASPSSAPPPSVLPPAAAPSPVAAGSH